MKFGLGRLYVLCLVQELLRLGCVPSSENAGEFNRASDCVLKLHPFESTVSKAIRDRLFDLGR